MNFVERACLIIDEIIGKDLTEGDDREEAIGMIVDAMERAENGMDTA